MSARWVLAAVLPAESSRFVEAVGRVEGFTHVEVAALADRPAEHLAALADTGLFVACANLGCGLEAVEVEVRRRQMERQKRQVIDAAQLGATLVYLTPPIGEGAEVLACFGEGCDLLAAFAASRMLRLAVLPVPGTCLPDVPAALAWLDARPGIDLGLLEPDAEQVRYVRGRLTYVRLGSATMSAAQQEALRQAEYRGVVAVPGIAVEGVSPHAPLPL